MSSEIERPITVQQGKEILKEIQNANYKAKNETRKHDFDDATLRLSILDGDVCTSCEYLRLFKRVDQGEKRVSMRCAAGLSPLKLYIDVPKEKLTEIECLKRVPVKGR